jgi:glycosyltransferase involved in cell wall biosynthesis
MKKILIVIPGISTGGVLSSLIALLNSSFTSRYQVHLFAMSSYRLANNDCLHKYILKCNKLSSLVYTQVASSKGSFKCCLLLFKVLLRIPFFGGFLKSVIDSLTIKKLEQEQYDYVISFQETLSLQFVSKFSNPNKITWIHCDYSRIYSDFQYEMNIFSRYSKIIAVSEYTRSLFCQLFPTLSSKTYSIYNIMDEDHINTKSCDVIDDIRFDNKCFTIISVGRIVSIKQFHLIPKIAAEIQENGASFKWYILGGGCERVALQELQSAIKKYSVENSVFCLGNKLNPYPYYKKANLLVSVSASEACPMIFNEAKILKLPIVTNNFGSAYEFIRDGRDGRICSIDKMSNVISDIIQNKRTFNPLISDNFKEKNIQQKLDDILN